MKQKGGLDKISQIISISNNYISHQKNLNKIKGLVDHSSPSRNSNINNYLLRKNTYRQVRKSLCEQQLTKQNQKIVQRITNITDRRNQSRMSTKSNQSMKRTLSAQVTNYKTRRNFMKSKQIEHENSKISQRIKNAHFKDGLAPKHYANLKQQSKSYKRVHSKFSDRSQSEMRQILNGLNYDHKKIPFLPILPSRRYSKL